MASALATSSFVVPTTRAGPNVRARKTLTIVANSKKTDIKKQGLNTIKNDVVKANLMGISRKMKDKDWTDSQGRKGKGYGVYRFSDKYGANVDGYSPIYTPDTWSESGETYKLGTKGLVAWAGLIAVLLSVGAGLIISTSQIGS